MQGFIKTEVGNINQILFCTDPQVSVGIIVSDTGVTADDDGNKIVKAGTPMYGKLTDRDTAFTVSAATTGDKPVGVLLHDVDVTAGADNGTLLIFGFVNKNRLDATTAAALAAATPAGITVLAG